MPSQSVKIALRLRPNKKKPPESLLGDCVEIRETVKGKTHVHCAQPRKTLVVDKNTQQRNLHDPSKWEYNERTEDGHLRDKTFAFDYVFGETDTNTKVFEQMGRDNVSQLLKGFNITIFCYGATGSGKTHTMFGPDKEDGFDPDTYDFGIAPRMYYNLFEQTRRMQDDMNYCLDVLDAQSWLKEYEGVGLTLDKLSYSTEINLHFVEIYSENVRDLITNMHAKKKISIVMDDKKKGAVKLNIAGVPVTSPEAVDSLVNKGTKFRVSASTACNHRSSRSHAIIILTINQIVYVKFDKDLYERMTGTKKLPKNKDKFVGLNYFSKAFLVDLAGSERIDKTGATGKTAREGIAINQSLSTLGNVILQLASDDPKKKKMVIPYRNSKLTYLLKDSLGGSAMTTMIAAASLSDYSFEETFRTLEYAAQANKIQQVVERGFKDLVAGLRDQLLRAQQEIEKLRSQLSGDELTSKIQEIEKRENELLNERERMEQAFEQKLAEQAEELQKALESSQNSNYVNEFMELNQQMDVLKGQIGEKKDRLSFLKNQCIDVLPDLRELMEKKASVEERIAHVESIPGRQAELPKLNAELRTATEGIASLRANNQMLDEMLVLREEIQTMYAQYQDTLQKLETDEDIGALKDQLEERLKNKFKKQLTKIKDKYTRDLKLKNERLVEEQEEKTLMDATLKGYRLEISSLQKKLDEFDLRKRAQGEYIRKMQEFKDRMMRVMRAQKEEFETKLHDAIQETLDYKQQIFELNERNASLKKENKQMKRQMQHMQQQ
ncbi:hypothetical protein PCE1_001670 [Barthelona sp. PCE]